MKNLEAIVGQGYTKVPGQYYAGCEIYKLEEKRMLYNPKTDTIDFTYLKK